MSKEVSIKFPAKEPILDEDEVNDIMPLVPTCTIESLLFDCLHQSKIPTEPQPSMRKVKGALLVVDISGFTLLSNKVSVDEFQNVINTYFATLLNVVCHHNGDVVKYAGDSIFILWSTSSPDPTNTELLNCVRTALSCISELNETCSQYKVKIGNGQQNWLEESTDGIIEKLGSKYHFLNIHSSLTSGDIAVINIGHKGRWECLLAGEPVNKLVYTIDQAAQGKVVLCKETHDLLSLTGSISATCEGSHSKCSCVVKRDCYEYNAEHHQNHFLAEPGSITQRTLKEIIEDFVVSQPKTRRLFLDRKVLIQSIQNILPLFVHESSRCLLEFCGDKESVHSENLISDLRNVVSIFIKVPVHITDEVRFQFLYYNLCSQSCLFCFVGHKP